MKLTIYVMRTVALRILAAAAILLAILQILDLLDVTTEILDRGLGLGGVAYYATLRFPRLLEQVAPLSVLAGGLFAFSQLARESAVIAMRATGVSVYRLVGMAAPAAAAMMLLDYATVELIAPRTAPILEAWWRDTAPKTPATPGPRCTSTCTRRDSASWRFVTTEPFGSITASRSSSLLYEYA